MLLVGILLLSEKVKSIGKLYTRYLIGLFCLPPIFAKANTAIHSSATFKSNFNCELVKFVFFANRYQTSMPMDLFLSFSFSYHSWIGPFLVLQGSQSKHRKWSIPPFKYLYFLSYPARARAVTGRRCPHSGEGEDFLTGGWYPGFLIE